MNNRWLFRLPLCIMVAGCANTEPYRPPESGPRAKLRIVSLPGDNTLIREGTQANCVSDQGREIAFLGKRLLIDKGASKRVDMPLLADVPAKLTTELFIPAQQPFTVEIGAIYGGIPIGAYSWCRRAVTFRPDEGKDYEIVYQFSEPECWATVSSIERTRNQPVRVELPSYNVSPDRCR